MTGTLQTNRKEVPKTVVQLQKALNRVVVPRATGHYIHNKEDVYVCSRDNSCVCFMPNEYPGHSDAKSRDRNVISLEYFSLIFHFLLQ